MADICFNGLAAYLKCETPGFKGSIPHLPFETLYFSVRRNTLLQIEFSLNYKKFVMLPTNQQRLTRGRAK